MAMAEEDDDPVVHEVDVYLSKSPSSQLYLFQYPIRPSQQTMDEMTIQRARMKPNQQKVELEIALNPNSSTFDVSKAEQFALNVDGKTKGDDRYFNSDLMDKQLLTSTKLPGDPSRYVVGWMKNGNLYLRPITGALKLRPRFAHLDRSDSKQRQENKEEGGDEGGGEEEEEAMEQVTVKFARPDSDKQKKAREKSFRYLQQTMAEEPWVDYTYHHFEAERSDNERRRLFCNHNVPQSSRQFASREDYLETFFSDHVDTMRFASLNLQAGNSSSATSDQVKTLFMNARVLAFDHLLSLLKSNIDSNTTLHLVQQVAVLVQGCWVVKSDLLYSKETCNSASTPVPTNVMVRGRDYVLWSFCKSRTVNRQDMAAATKLPQEELIEILQQVSVLNGNRAWEFALPTDVEFGKKYPEVYQRQQMLWDNRYQQLVKQLKISKNPSGEGTV